MSAKALNFQIVPLCQVALDRDFTDFEKIREISSHALDECPVEDRAYAWMAMVRVYPKDPTTWQSSKEEMFKTYWDLVDDHLKNWHTLHLPNQMCADQFDVPNKHLMAIIHGDIVRTGKTIFFFPPEPIPGATPKEEDDAIFQFGVHARRLERILYTFASFNIGLGYMQGFNELLPPFYYVLLQAKQMFGDDMDMIEALSFQCFQKLLIETEIRELYMTTDKSSIIYHRLDEFNKLLEKHLPNDYTIINNLGIHPLLYCYRWFNLMFSQEYDLPTLLNIWDCLFSHFDDLIDFVFYVGLGHVKAVEGRIKKGDYGSTIAALQNLDITPPKVKEILEFSNDCWMKDHTKASVFDKFTNFFK